MWSSHVYYKTSDKEVIKRALRRLEESVFYAWHSKPEVRILPLRKWDNKKEFRILLKYDGFGDNNECEHGHEALDLVQAFIEGVLWSKRSSRVHKPKTKRFGFCAKCSHRIVEKKFCALNGNPIEYEELIGCKIEKNPKAGENCPLVRGFSS